MALKKIAALSIMLLAGGMVYFGSAVNASASPLINSGLVQGLQTSASADLGQKVGYRGRGGFLQFYIGPRYGYRHNYRPRYRRGHRYGYRNSHRGYGYGYGRRGGNYYNHRRGYGHRSYGGHSGGGSYGGWGREGVR